MRVIGQRVASPAVTLVLGGGNTSLVLAHCTEHFKRLGGACRKGRAIYAQPH